MSHNIKTIHMSPHVNSLHKALSVYRTIRPSFDNRFGISQKQQNQLENRKKTFIHSFIQSFIHSCFWLQLVSAIPDCVSPTHPFIHSSFIHSSFIHSFFIYSLRKFTPLYKIYKNCFSFILLID